MTARGPRKGEPSSAPMRNGFRTQPARVVRGSSRRIMTMRFRPANIRVINRRVCSWAVIGPAVQTKTHSRLTSGNVFPLRRPSTGARVPERCSPSRVRFAAPNSGAPLTAARRSGRTDVATGGSGGNTARGLRQKNKGRRTSCGGEPARFKTVSPGGRLTRSLHIRGRACPARAPARPPAYRPKRVAVPADTRLRAAHPLC
jgi:hypothetical protein